MNKFPVKLKIFFGFLMAAIGIGFFVFSTFMNARKTLVDSKSVTEELAVMRNIESILDAMQDVETSYRGYLISGDSVYLQPYFRSIVTLDQTLRNLKTNSSNFEEQAQLWPAVNHFVREKIVFANKIIRSRQQNKIREANEVFQSGEGRILMDSIRSVSQKMEVFGRDYFQKSNDKKQLLVDKTKNYFVVLSILIFSLLITFYLIISADLDKSKEAQERINEANDKIIDLYDHAPCGYLSTNQDFLITEINQTALKWLGYHVEEVKGKLTIADLTQSELASFFRKDEPFETILFTKDQKKIPVQIDYSIEKNHGNHYRIVLIDLSQKKDDEYKLNYFTQLINQTSDAILSTDSSLKIVSWNRGAEKLYGYSEKEAKGKLGAELLRTRFTTEDERKEIFNILNSKGSWYGELVHLRKDGSEVHVLGSVSAVRDADTNHIGYISINQDITELKKYEFELKKFNEELIQRVEEKTSEVKETLERLTDAFFALDKKFIVTLTNKKGFEMMNVDNKEVLGRNIFEMYPELSLNPFGKQFFLAMDTQQPLEYEGVYPTNNRWFNMRIYPSPNGLSVFVQDVTAKHESQLKILESERKYKLLFENNPFPMWVLDSETLDVRDVNKAAEDHYGYSYSQFTGMNFLDLFEGDQEQRSAYRKKFNIPFFAGVISHKRKDDKLLKVEVFFYEILIEGEERKIVVANDVTDLLSYQEELKDSRDQLRLLSGYMEKIREEERTSIAREIHDELGQQLTGLKMDISWISKKIAEGTPVHERIATALLLIDDTIKTVRRIATDLRPGILDDFGLIAALEWQSREFEKRTGIECIFVTELADEPFEKSLATGIFRIYQEALTNVARHAKATRVSTEFMRSNSAIHLTIRDNGIGISEDPIKRKTLGLIGMQERALMINGQLSFISRPDEGTTIHLELPLMESKSSTIIAFK